LDRTSGVSAECAAWIQKAMVHAEAGQLAEADATLAAALTRLDSGSGSSCAGLILHNQATIASISGRFAEGEQLALRAISALEKIYPPDDRALLRPLLVLASTRLEQGNKSGARIAFGRLNGIRTEQPRERAMIHATCGSLMQSVGERGQAEAEYLAALDAWTEIGRDETADAGALFTALATLYIEERRFEEAGRLVDQASSIFSKIRDAAPMDRSKLLGVRGSLHAALGEWPSAENDFREALLVADGQAAISTAHTVILLNGLAEALKRNHHRQEARRIEARTAALVRANPRNTIVDASDLVGTPKPKRK
jgi:tetratricopeptide (TPR) repeat protein